MWGSCHCPMISFPWQKASWWGRVVQVFRCSPHAGCDPCLSPVHVISSVYCSVIFLFLVLSSSGLNKIFSYQPLIIIWCCCWGFTLTGKADLSHPHPSTSSYGLWKPLLHLTKRKQYFFSHVISFLGRFQHYSIWALLSYTKSLGSHMNCSYHFDDSTVSKSVRILASG